MVMVTEHVEFMNEISSINYGDGPTHILHAVEHVEFMKTLEEDARERGERRKEREAQGRDHKKRGNTAGQFENAVTEFSVALRHTPWDISLYTNRAQTQTTKIKMCRH